MKLEADARLAFPRETVFTTYRDRLPALVPHLPNLREIKVERREDGAAGPGTTRILNLWMAKGEVPKVAQGLVRPDKLNWYDHALWDEREWWCDWRVETQLFTENVRCQGRNWFLPDGPDRSILQIRGELDIDLAGIPGVPKFLAGTVAPVVERFIVALITPNLLSVSKGVEAFLREEAARASGAAERRAAG